MYVIVVMKRYYKCNFTTTDPHVYRVGLNKYKLFYPSGYNKINVGTYIN